MAGSAFDVHPLAWLAVVALCVIFAWRPDFWHKIERPFMRHHPQGWLGDHYFGVAGVGGAMGLHWLLSGVSTVGASVFVLLCALAAGAGFVWGYSFRWRNRVDRGWVALSWLAGYSLTTSIATLVVGLPLLLAVVAAGAFFLPKGGEALADDD